MVLPLIPLVIFGISAATGGTGLFNGARGVSKLNTAKAQADAADEDLACDNQEVLERSKDLDQCLRLYGEQQEIAWTATVTRMADFIRRHERKLRQSYSEVLDGAVAETRKLDPHELTVLDGVGWFTSAVTAGATGIGAYLGVPAAVSVLGTASTGTAISGLSGVAATNATAAWLGGGSLAASGGGMALGAAALTAGAVGPGLLVAGLVMNGRGTAALTKAAEHKALVEKTKAENEGMRIRFAALTQRVTELSSLVGRLESRAVTALDVLESKPFDSDRDAARFSTALQYVLAVRDVLTAPLMDESGDMSAESQRMLLLYREQGEESSR